MAIELPSWVPEFEEEYNRFKKKNIISVIGTGLLLISLIVLVYFNEIIKNNLYIKILLFISIGVGLLLFVAYTNRKLPSASKYMASMVYSIGFNLEKNSDPESKIYISKMNNYLKNCDDIITEIDDSLEGAMYVDNIRDYLGKLIQIIKLLNEYNINYPQYNIDKSLFSKKIIQLADIIHRDKEYVKPENIDVINSLINDLKNQNVKEKPLYISKIEKFNSMLKTFIGGLPYSLKIIIYIIIVFFIVYELITYVALTKEIPQETTFGYAVGGGIAALVPALMVREHILKK